MRLSSVLAEQLTGQQRVPSASLWRWRKAPFRIAIAFSISYALIASWEGSAVAQNIPVPDTTLGSENSTVTPINPTVDQINGGATRGVNLFHSFLEFNIGDGRAVYFTNPAGIQNILTRVTGTNASNIFGTLGVTGGNANLFLINPNGVVFGQNARLDVGGSFVATTANAIGLANGDIFSANTSVPLPSQLLNVNPNASFFNQMAAQSITSQARLQVPDGESLLLLGGNVSLDGGKLIASGGRVELGGVAEEGTVGLSVNGNELRFNFPDGVARTDVSLTNGAQVNVLAGGGGSIAINARNLNMTGENTQLLAGIELGRGSLDARAGDIDINATETITLTDSAFLRASTYGKGDAGSVNITTGSLAVTNGAFLDASTGGQGDAGSLNIFARDTVTFDGLGKNGGPCSVCSIVGRASVGNGSSISITAGSLVVTNGARLIASTFGQGDAGSVNILTRDTVLFDGVGNDGLASAAFSNVESTGKGKGGSVNITTGSLAVTNGAYLSTRSFNRGDAGSVTINARDTVTIDGLGNRKSIRGVAESSAVLVESTGEGNGGDINITTGSLAVTNSAYLRASTYGKGDAGSVNITVGSLRVTNGAFLDASTGGQGDAGSLNIFARDTVSFDGVGTAAYSLVGDQAVGNGGSINITTGALRVTNGAFLRASTYGKGDAGSVNITVRSLAATNGAFLDASTGGQGDAGSLNIFARDTVSFDGVGTAAYSLVGDRAVGNGGSINITTGALRVTNGAFLRASTYGKGDAGSVNITVRSLVVTNGAFLDASTGGRGDAGGVNIFARDTVSLDGVGINGGSCAVCSIVGTVGVGKGGGINITTGSLFVTNGALLSATTFGKGDAGNIVLNVADSINVSGVSSRGYSSGLLTGTELTASGQGDDIRVTTGALRVSDGAVLSARTFNEKSGGNIIVNANTVELTNGGQFLTTAYSSGRAGNISVNATDHITISGTDPTFPDRLAKFGRPTVDPAGSASGFFANTDPNSTGNGGSISINTPQLNITDGAGIAVNSEGKGNGGELLIQSDTLTLARQAFLSAATASGEGGNMTLQVQDLLLMRHGSLISTEAGNNGNGGNMNINAKFIVAVPKEDSDIVANAFRGRGGNINITTQGIYGLQYRPQRTPLSDITASSQFGVNGTVQINSLDVDPSRGLTNLPENLVDSSALIANSCIARSRQQGGSFTITGRGGLPTRPGDAFTSSYPTGTVRSLPNSSASNHTPSSDLEVTNPEHSQPPRIAEPIDRIRQSLQAQNLSDATSSYTPTPPTPAPLVEASGWMYGANGEVILTAQSPTVTPHGSWSPPPNCH